MGRTHRVRLSAGGDAGHGLVDAIGMAQKGGGLAIADVTHLPEVVSVAILQLADVGQRAVVEHPATVWRHPVGRVYGVQVVDQLVGRNGRSTSWCITRG